MSDTIKIEIIEETPGPKVVIKKVPSSDEQILEEMCELSLTVYKIPLSEVNKYIPIQEKIDGKENLYLVQPFDGRYRILEVIKYCQKVYSAIEVIDENLIERIKRKACLL